MSTFSLSFNFPHLGTTSVNKGESFLVQTYDNDFVNTFFNWLEGKKYYPESSIHYLTDTINTSDLRTIRKYIKTLRFRLSDNESDSFYYQQRYHATENNDIRTLNDYLGTISDLYFQQIAIQLGLNQLLGEKINMLSTGEFRKAFVLKAAMEKPNIMFIEEPYVGIDTESCQLLNQLFEHLVQNETSIVVFTSTNRKPDYITHTINIDTSDYQVDTNNNTTISIPNSPYNLDFETAFELKNIVAKYNGRDVLHQINWTVNRNEKWSLTGHNGAGKSTLLSFVYADNPQVYCNEVYLFGKKRGSGESIWDIKDKIGFYSSELHRYFDKLQTVESAIKSIVLQNPHKKRVLSNEEETFKVQLLNYFHLDGLEKKMMYDLSSVNQKLILLIAILLKNPPLLILDEPFQGFNNQLITKTLSLLDKYIEHRTFIMVSHNNTDFPKCINKHFCLKNGIGNEFVQLENIQTEEC